MRTLIVEDEALVAMLLEEMLDGLGCKVVGIAGRMDAAMALANDLAIDLAIVDVNLNGVQTYPLAEALSRRGVPFIFATGYGVAGLDPAWQGTPTLEKPFQAIDLERALEEVRRKPS